MGSSGRRWTDPRLIALGYQLRAELRTFAKPLTAYRAGLEREGFTQGRSVRAAIEMQKSWFSAVWATAFGDVGADEGLEEDEEDED